MEAGTTIITKTIKAGARVVGGGVHHVSRAGKRTCSRALARSAEAIAVMPSSPTPQPLHENSSSCSLAVSDYISGSNGREDRRESQSRAAFGGGSRRGSPGRACAGRGIRSERLLRARGCGAARPALLGARPPRRSG